MHRRPHLRHRSREYDRRVILDIQNGVLAEVIAADGDAALRARARELAALIGAGPGTRSVGRVVFGADGRVAWWAGVFAVCQAILAVCFFLWRPVV